MRKIKPNNVVYKIEDSKLAVWEKGELSLSFFTDHWKWNQKIWGEEVRQRNLREMMKIEGFEEWYNHTYPKIPDFHEIHNAHYLSNSTTCFSETLFEMLTDAQKIQLYKKLKRDTVDAS